MVEKVQEINCKTRDSTVRTKRRDKTLQSSRGSNGEIFDDAVLWYYNYRRFRY